MARILSEQIVAAVGVGKDPAEVTVLGTLTNLTATAAELNVVAGVTAGTTTASKALVVDANKVINGALWRIPVNADVAGTGSVVGDAAQLLEGFTVITGANGTLAWKLPATPVAGTIVIVKGTTAGVAKIFPDAAATINAIGSNGAISLASGVIPAIFIAKSTTQWYTLPLLPS